MSGRIWEMYAYAARYGHQPMSELRAMPLQDLVRLCKELSSIVKEEARG